MGCELIWMMKLFYIDEVYHDNASNINSGCTYLDSLGSATTNRNDIPPKEPRQVPSVIYSWPMFVER